MSKRRVSYYFEPEGSSHFFSAHHPMEPQRVNMTHELVQNYGLFNKMEILRFDKATEDELKAIHLSDYIDHLIRVAPGNVSAYNSRRQAYDANEDCPMFRGVYDYTASSVGGSLGNRIL
ncbi:histone deacetylase [Entomophthora muscae]|uniref:Histone deacetylase n=1 Tax=Entomophthora muscae TaxID=34485 RepID=A0ACC2T032_9FUNG|nr:histone deacetylase [Entomophthora muscae]